MQTKEELKNLDDNFDLDKILSNIEKLNKKIEEQTISLQKSLEQNKENL